MENKKIKLLVIYSDRTGVGKFRSIGPHTYIQEHYPDDFDIDIMGMGDIPAEDTESFLKQYDLVHFHKQLDPNMRIMNMLKFMDIPCIIDIDDYFFLGNDHPMSLAAEKEKWHIPIINHLKMADYVTTTTPIYAAEIKKYNPHVFVIPNAIDPQEKQFAVPKIKSDKLRIGLICGSTHLHDIQLMEGLSFLPDEYMKKIQYVLCGFDIKGTMTIYDQKTGQATRKPIQPHESVWARYEEILTRNYEIVSPEHKEFLLKYMAGVDDPFMNEPYRRMWTRNINEYATHYQNVDVLLAPLKENDFNKMKSQLKEIEAGFTHTALIAQKFGAYTIDLTSMVGFGGKIDENGTALLVDSRKNHKEWAKYVKMVADSPDMVKKLQDNLYNLVKDKYSLEAVCKERVEIYKKILEEKNKNF
jgi:glycosyltransferase involved in cell wall biosynthesis